ncbi:WD repeat and SOCS box-containing protein 1 [Aplysia californica]|uniref:WD repeat and SOCS box-containing protein 1 n=1 Tax=Aplysia californica TaxID=6500 RepID=A0ABM0K242_APLCA|nr:WD repeat and SOCS box-containing protein 1 [Aplysia californica]
MRQVKSSSFEFLEPDQIDQADVSDHLTAALSPYNSGKSGREGWTCAWAPDSSYFAWSSGYRILHLIPWDANKKKRHDPADTEGLKERKYHMIDCGELIWALAFGSGLPQKASHIYRHCSYDKNLVVATGLASGRIKLFNCFTGSVIVELLDHRDTVRGLDFSKDGSLQLMSGSRDGTLKLWDLNNEGNMYCTHKARAKVNACKFSMNGKFAAAVGTNKTVLLWHGPIKDSPFYRLEGHHNEVVGVDFSSDSVLMATASFDTRVIIWNAYRVQRLRELGHLHPSPSLIFAGGANDNFVRSVNFSRDGVNVATVCDDGFVRFWHWEEDGDPVSVLQVSDPLCGQFSSDGTVLGVGTRSGDAQFVCAPQPLPSLLQLSRVAVRKAMRSDSVDGLPLPYLLKHFLKYRDFLKDDSRLL